MREEKLLSIIVPVYNGETFLAETLESITNVSYKNIEIIIIDDGSADESESIYRKFANADDRFVIIKQSNQGIAGARNTGLKVAKGDYLVFCDQDDLVGEFFYEYAIDKMEKDNSNMCICSTAKFYEKKYVAYERHVDRLYSKEEVINKLLYPFLFRNFQFDKETQLYGCMTTLWNCVFEKKLIDENKLVFKKNIHYEDDMIMRFEAMLAAEKISTLEYCGYFWRTNLSSESHRGKYTEEMGKKQELTRSYLKEELVKRNQFDLAMAYENCQKVRDCIIELENETFRHVAYKDKHRTIVDSFTKTIDEHVKECSLKLNKSEIRYRVVWHFLRKDKYTIAYFVNAFLCKIIRLLNVLKIANTAEVLVKKLK